MSCAPFVLDLSANPKTAAQTYLVMGIKVHFIPPLVYVRT